MDAIHANWVNNASKIQEAATSDKLLAYRRAIRVEAMKEAAEVVLRDLVPHPKTEYQRQYNATLIPTAKSIEDLA